MQPTRVAIAGIGTKDIDCREERDILAYFTLEVMFSIGSSVISCKSISCICTLFELMIIICMLLMDVTCDRPCRH